MIHTIRIAIVLTCCLFQAVPFLTAQEAVTIIPANVRSDVSEKPFGVNFGTMFDDQANRPTGARSLTTALEDAGMKFLRFPGGEESDVYNWAAPPYNDPTTSGINRISDYDFPAAFPSIWNRAEGTWAQDNYDFDEFMADCQTIGAEPVIVVAFDGIYKPASPGGTSLTYDEALTMAVEWVRYANITKGYGIKYWSLGNETFHENGFGGANPGYEQYGIDAAAFAQAMKAVDPTIKIGINGNTYNDFNLALAACAPYVDFLDVHAYPCYGFESYSEYENATISATTVVDRAQSAINAVADETDRERLFIALTEISAYGYSEELTGSMKSWDAGHNLGQSLANFDLMAQLAQDGRLAFAQFWATRWMNNDSEQPQSTDLLSKTNTLNASGTAISILNLEALDNMVNAQGTDKVRAFASTDESTGDLTVFLLNKATAGTEVNLNLQGYSPTAVAQRFVYGGTSIADVNPTYTQEADVTVTGPEVELSLDPNSITVLKFSGVIEDCGANLVLNPGFEDSSEGIAPWDVALSGTGNGGLTDGQKLNGSFSGYVGGVTAYLFQIVTGLMPETDYTLTFNVYNFKDGGSNVLLGAKNFGGDEVFREIDDTGFAFQPEVFEFTTGEDATSVEIYLFNDNDATFAWIDDVSLVCSDTMVSTSFPLLERTTTTFYPNPAGDLLSLDSDQIVDGLAYRIYDLAAGRKVREGVVRGRNISLAGLSAGGYFVWLSDGSGGKVMKE